MFLKKVYFIVLSFFFISCGGDSVTDSDGSYSLYNISLATYIYSSRDRERDNKNDEVDCSQKEQNRVVYNKMKDSYLWYDYVPDIEYSEYNSSEKLLDDLKYKEYDRWSYITTTSKYTDYYEKGIYKGFGFSLYQYNNKLFIKYVYEDSSANIVGFRRGTEILEINGKTILEIEEENLWRTILGDSVVGTESRFKIINSDIENIVILEKKSINVNSIFFETIMDIDGKRVGYFVLNMFIEPTRSELDTLFEKFKREKVDELILDMRYNGGGRVDIANYLASLIHGESSDTTLFGTLEFNDKYTNLNKIINFTKEKNSLNLDRVFIISTDRTCSASELVINGLEPYMTVNLIGSKTCGKPVGMRGVDFCGKHLSPIEFKTTNADGYGDYFSGITPRCVVSDDISHPLGDRNESMLKETLFFMKNGICLDVEKRYEIEKSHIDKEKSLLKGFSLEVGAI